MRSNLFGRILLTTHQDHIPAYMKIFTHKIGVRRNHRFVAIIYICCFYFDDGLLTSQNELRIDFRVRLIFVFQADEEPHSAVLVKQTQASIKLCENDFSFWQKIEISGEMLWFRFHQFVEYC